MPIMKKLFSRTSKTTKREHQTPQNAIDPSTASSPPSAAELGVVTAISSANTTPASSLTTGAPSASTEQIPAATHREAIPLVGSRHADAPITPKGLETSHTSKELNPGDITIVVNDLKMDERRAHGIRGEDPGGTRYVQRHSATFRMQMCAPLFELWSKILDAGFYVPNQLAKLDGKAYEKRTTKTQVEPFDEVMVTDGRISDPNLIGLDERLIGFNDRRYGEPFQLNITEDSATDRKATDCLRDNRALKITFLRTTRMPDDDKLHNLPAALGTFPLYNVAAYADALPSKIVDEGGVFLPMWQREALWIGFESNVVDRYAIRVSIGRVNAISGQNIDTESNIDWFGNITQDYVVVPGQDWLDGICVGPGIVRQFVAMPLGSGYTVEGQKTGEEKHGGLQLEIIPSLRERLRGWLRSDLVPLDPAQFRMLFYRGGWLSERKTPRDLGLAIGDKICGYPLPPFQEVPCVMSDMIDPDQEQAVLSARYKTDEVEAAREEQFSSVRDSDQSAFKPARAPRAQAQRPAESTSPSAHFPPRSNSEGQPSPSPRKLEDDNVLQMCDHLSSPPRQTPILKSEKTSLTDAPYTSSAGPTPTALNNVNDPSNGDDDGELYRSAADSDPEFGADDDRAIDSTDEGLRTYRSAADSDPEFEAAIDEAINAPDKALRTMGLAAGGFLMQDIYKDDNDPSIWSTAGSKLINVHILDPASCESVTHVVPAPPPIDVEAYAKAGLQFYTVEERPEERLDGGDFDNIKSVAAMDKQKMQMEEKPLDPTVLMECRCGKRLCDCVVRPCNHQFCHICVREVDSLSGTSGHAQGTLKASRKCPVCRAAVAHVAGFSAPMNLPGEEPIKMRVPVQVLEVRDGRMAFKSIVKSRI